jgi:hypothetical protein
MEQALMTRSRMLLKGDEAGAKFGGPKMNALKLLLASAGRHYVRI